MNEVFIINEKLTAIIGQKKVVKYYQNENLYVLLVSVWTKLKNNQLKQKTKWPRRQKLAEIPATNSNQLPKITKDHTKTHISKIKLYCAFLHAAYRNKI